MLLPATDAGAKPKGHAQSRPNIVLIQSDDATVGDLDYMPTVQRRLIERGTNFASFFNSYPLCCPARTTLLTGQFSHNHHVLSNFFSNDGGYYTFDSLPGKRNQSNSLGPWMQAAGYRTAMVGKFLNEYGVRDRREVPPGWNMWAGLVDQSTYDYYNYAINHNGKLDFHGDRSYAKKQLRLGTLSNAHPPTSFTELLDIFHEVFDPWDEFGAQRNKDYTMNVTGGYAARFVRDAAPSRKPFFLYYSPPGPHAEETNHLQGLRPNADPDPRPPARYRHTFDDVELPRPPSFNEADVSDKLSNIKDQPALTPEQIDEMTANYRGRLGAVRAVDDQIGRIIKQLRRAGELRNTYVIYNSDNGFMQGEHRIRSSKFLPFEDSIHTPTVIAGPGIKPGRSIGRSAIDVDLAPTILDMAGAEAGRVEDGISLLPAAKGKRKLPKRRPVPIEALRPLFKFFTPLTAFDVPYYGVRTSRYKYVHWSFDEVELYDLRKDPDELDNLAPNPDYAAVVDRLEAKAAALQDCQGVECRR